MESGNKSSSTTQDVDGQVVKLSTCKKASSGGPEEEEEDINLVWEDYNSDSPITVMNENTKIVRDASIQNQTKEISSDCKSTDGKIITAHQPEAADNTEKSAEVSNQSIDEDELLKLTPDDEKRNSDSEINISLNEDIILDSDDSLKEDVKNCDKGKEELGMDLQSGDKKTVESDTSNILINNTSPKNLVEYKCDGEQALDSIQSPDFNLDLKDNHQDLAQVDDSPNVDEKAVHDRSNTENKIEIDVDTPVVPDESNKTNNPEDSQSLISHEITPTQQKNLLSPLLTDDPKADIDEVEKIDNTLSLKTTEINTDISKEDNALKNCSTIEEYSEKKNDVPVLENITNLNDETEIIERKLGTVQSYPVDSNPTDESVKTTDTSSNERDVDTLKPELKVIEKTEGDKKSAAKSDNSFDIPKVIQADKNEPDAMDNISSSVICADIVELSIDVQSGHEVTCDISKVTEKEMDIHTCDNPTDIDDLTKEIVDASNDDKNLTEESTNEITTSTDNVKDKMDTFDISKLAEKDMNIDICKDSKVIDDFTKVIEKTSNENGDQTVESSSEITTLSDNVKDKIETSSDISKAAEMDIDTSENSQGIDNDTKVLEETCNDDKTQTVELSGKNTTPTNKAIDKMDTDVADNCQVKNKIGNDKAEKLSLENDISNAIEKADIVEKKENFPQISSNINENTEKATLDITSKISSAASEKDTKLIEEELTDNSQNTHEPSVNVDNRRENLDDKSENSNNKSENTNDKSENSNDKSENSNDKVESVGNKSEDDDENVIPKVTDSLGLLTESSRVVEEDDDQEPEDEEDNENDDDDDDSDHDEESNQMPLDHSEDSNDPVILKEKSEVLSTDDDISSDAAHVLISSEENLDTNDGSNEDKIDICALEAADLNMKQETDQATSFLEGILQGKRKDSSDSAEDSSNKKQKTQHDVDEIDILDPIKPTPPTEDETYAKIQAILSGVRNMTPLLDLDIEKVCDDLVEISDSDSENENEAVSDELKIGAKGAQMLEEVLADTINDVWKRFDLDDRLQSAKDDVMKQMDHVEAERKKIDEMLRDCQRQTDALRTQVYKMFAPTIKTLPSIDIYDTPTYQTTKVHSYDSGDANEHRRPRPARTLKDALKTEKDDTAADDDVSVVRLKAEVPPAGLPPPGRPSRPPLSPGRPVYAMRHAFGSWLRATVMDVTGHGATSATSQFTAFRVKFVHKVKSPVKQISGRHVAYTEPPNARLTIGARVIALCKDTNTKKEAFFSGIIAEIPNPVNNYRYLVFFDDGYAQYVRHEHTRLVYECSSSVWEEVHPFSMEFVRKYLVAYPERPMVRLHAGQSLKAEWNGKWWDTIVMQVDASLVKVYFKEDNHSEWIYRGSTRLAPLYVELAAKGRPRAHRATANVIQPTKNVPYVEYTRDQKDVKANESATPQITQELKPKQAEKIALAVNDQPPISAKTNDNVISRVVYFTPKAAVKPYKMSPHKCSPQCKRTDVLPLKELRTYNPLSKPLLSGWERQLVRSTGRKRVMYRGPCGRRVRNMDELHQYLRLTNSEMAVDLFDFSPTTHCLAEFELKRCHVSKKDLSQGKELVPVPCVNYYDNTLPEFCVYNTVRTPTDGVHLNLDTDFLCGCDCTDDCADKSKCACWKMTIEGAATIGMDTTDVGYVYKRLLDPVPSGIYECNSRCKCKSTCLNRVAQQPLQLKLQVFKTLNRGWGIRALNDVPRGAFICVYVGNLLTDATANLDGLNEGDEYLAELDYIEVVEQMKQDYEEDIPERDKQLDKKALEEEDENELSSSEEEHTSTNDNEDDDFRPIGVDFGNIDKSTYKKTLRKRKSKKGEEATKEKEKEKDKTGSGDDCITISDDEEVREPSRFSAPTDMGVTNFVPKYKSVRSYFGEDEAVYTMDAKVQGNIGRYLNHSCAPNVFVQNVFVDTHDPRFPWVAFFALSYIRAGTELTWNYNYDIGSVNDKVLYCYCGAPNCRGRLL